MKIWKRTKEDVVTNHLSLTLPQNTKSLATKELSDLPEDYLSGKILDMEIETSMPTFRTIFARDVGTVEVSVLAEIEVTRVIVAPEPSEDQTAHAPYFSSGYAPFVTVGKNGKIHVSIDSSSFSSENENTVDIFGSLSVSNHDGSQILVANYSVVGASGSMQKLSPDLTVVRKVGKDLCVKTGDNIQSKSGGSFNVVLNSQVTWS